MVAASFVATEASDQREVPGFAIPFGSPALGAAATSFPIPTGQEALRTLSRRLVAAPEERPAAASFDMETVLHADGSALVVSGGERNPITVVFFMASCAHLRSGVDRTARAARPAPGLRWPPWGRSSDCLMAKSQPW